MAILVYGLVTRPISVSVERHITIDIHMSRTIRIPASVEFDTEVEVQPFDKATVRVTFDDGTIADYHGFVDNYVIGGETPDMRRVTVRFGP